MNQEQKRIAIAKACGWYDIDNMFGRHLTTTKQSLKMIPDYFNDLNATHKMEDMLSYGVDDWHTYDKHLAESELGFTWRATAAQRAEAFGKTLNLWT